jgi:hypothetical protein
MQGRENGIAQKVLQSIYPVVTSSSIYQDECVAKTPHQDTVAKGNVNMDNIQEAGLGAINSAPSGRLRDRRIRPKGQRKLATIDSLTGKAGLEDVLVISKTMTSKSPMKFFGGPMGLRVGTISPITRANGWKRRTLAMNQLGNIIPRQCQKEGRRTKSQMGKGHNGR